MRVIDLLDKPFQFASTGRTGKMASKSEIRQWCLDGAVLINGEKVSPTEEIDFPIISVVLFPNNEKRKTTIW